MTLFKKILIVLGKHGKREFVIQFFLMVISALLEMIGIASIPIVMRFILEPERLRSFPWLYTFLEKHNMLDTIQLFIVGSGVILSVFILKNLYRILVDYRQIAVVKTVQIRLATQLFQKYLLSSYSDYLKRNTSVMIRNIQNEVIYITSKVLVPVFLILLSVTILLGLLISLLIVEPMLTTVIFLVLLIAMSLFNIVVKKKLIGYGKIMQNERRVQLHYLYQGLQGYKAIKVANKEKFFTNLFDRTTRNFAKMQQKASILNKLPVGYLEVVSVFVILVMVGSLMIIGYTGNELTYLLSFFGLALIRMRQHFSVVMTNIGLIRANQVSFDPVIEDLTDTTLPLEKYNAESDSVPFIKEIVFDNVCFTYDGTEQAVIKNLNLKINKGEIIGIAGSTGGGKTTVVDILLGLHTPTTGKVMVDNIPLSSRNITAWQQQIGYVPQVIYLLDNTIKNNIAFGIDEHQIDDSLIEKVINLAQLDEFIDTLPDGINTEVGENGVRLSGGQRQRIGIARALYQSPELLILDEATSALDNITERKFMNMLYSLQPKVTILMIAHRLSTLKGCDNIIYLKNGMIDAQGTYNELIEKSQEFKNLTLSN